MERKKLSKLRDWVEPAHPMTVKLRNDLFALYTRIREKYQIEIDNAFDSISQQIGFVVTTSIPIVLEVGHKGTIEGVSIGAEHLIDTLFDRELIKTLEMLKDDPIPSLKAGKYEIYAFWFEALKLKLRSDWVEPAHTVGQIPIPMASRTKYDFRIRSRPEVREPAHWFDPGIAIAAEEAVLISVIDEVYPELRLVDRVASSREISRVRPEVIEPAHYFRFDPKMRYENPEELLKLIRKIVDRYES
jgi:hypothetical protein